MPASDALLFEVSALLGDGAPHLTTRVPSSRRHHRSTNKGLTTTTSSRAHHHHHRLEGVAEGRVVTSEAAALEEWVMGDSVRSDTPPTFTPVNANASTSGGEVGHDNGADVPSGRVPTAGRSTYTDLGNLHPQTESMMRKSERMMASGAVNQHPSPHRWRERVMGGTTMHHHDAHLDDDPPSTFAADTANSLLSDMALEEQNERYQRILYNERQRQEKLRLLVTSPSSNAHLEKEGKVLKFIVERLVAGAKTERDVEETEAILVRARQSQIRQCDEAVELLLDEQAVRSQTRDALLNKIASLNARAEQAMALGILQYQSLNQQRQQQHNQSNSTPQRGSVGRQGGNNRNGSPKGGRVPEVTFTYSPKAAGEEEWASSVPIAAGGFNSASVRQHIHHKMYAAKQEAKFKSKIDRIWCDPDLN